MKSTDDKERIETMKKDINVMYRDAMDIMEDLSIDVEIITSVRWNARLRSVWGRCIHNRRTNTYKIELNPILEDEDVSWDSAMNTMIHEVLHAHHDRFCHTGEWKRCAMLINYEYPHYNIERATTAEAKGVTDKIQSNYKYTIKCLNCGSISKYKSNTKVVRLVRNFPGSCRCTCGSTNLKLFEN